MANKKAMENDPWMINQDEVKDIKTGLKNASSGVICPKMNKQIGRPCKVCEALQPLWQYPKNSPERDLASQKKAKVNFYMNVVFSDNPNKSYIMEVGKKAGNAIVEGIEKKNWTDVAHPKAGKGRELMITKGQDSSGYNSYSVSPVLEKADWDIPDEVLDNLPNLDNIIDMIKNNELTDDNFIRVSDLKMGDSITFRMCPKSKNAEFFKFMAWVWRHWGGVTYEEVEGETKVDLSLDTVENSEDTEGSTPWDTEESSTPTSGGSSTEQPSEPSDKREPCFGKPEYFDASDDDCRECKDFKECKKACKSNMS